MVFFTAVLGGYKCLGDVYILTVGSHPSFMDYVGEIIFCSHNQSLFCTVDRESKMGEKGAAKVIKSYLHFSFNLVDVRSQYIEVVHISPVPLEMVKTHQCRHTSVSIYHYASSARFVV